MRAPAVPEGGWVGKMQDKNDYSQKRRKEEEKENEKFVDTSVIKPKVFKTYKFQQTN